MFGIGAPELIVILVIALIFIGPQKLPEVARTVGKGLRDLRRVTTQAEHEFRSTVDDLMREPDAEVPPARRERSQAELERAAEARRIVASAGQHVPAQTGPNAIAPPRAESSSPEGAGLTVGEPLDVREEPVAAPAVEATSSKPRPQPTAPIPGPRPGAE